MKRLALPLFLLFAASSLFCQEKPLALRDLPSLVLAKDPVVSSAEQSALLAYHTYQGTLSQALPQLDLSTSYSLDYLPSQVSQSFISLPIAPYYAIQSVTTNDQGTHNLGAKVSLSQLLPTAGTASLSLSNQTSIDSFGSQATTIGTTTTGAGGGAQYSQKPAVTLGITQPLFMNGKFLDLDLFPATFRKVRLGYLKADLAKQTQSNQSVSQATQLFLSVVQLRKNIDQSRKAIAVSQGNLDNLQKNFSLGLVSEADLLDQKISVATQKQALLQLQSSLTKAERSLAHSLGRESLDGAALDDGIPALQVPLGSDDLLAKAMENYPAIRQQGLALEEKKVDDILSGQKYASTLSLSLSYSPRYPAAALLSQYTTTDFARSFSDLYGSGSTSDITLSASLTIHLFDGGQQSEAHAGNMAVTRMAEDSLETQKQSVQDQVALDLASRDNLQDKVSLLSDATDLASRRLETEADLLALGKSTQLNVDSRRADYEAKQNDLWRAKADLFLTVLDLASLAGEDIARLIEGKSP